MSNRVTTWPLACDMKSYVLYNWECNSECDAGYDGQSSKNNYTRSGQHTALYESWTRHEAGVINPKSKKPYSKPQSHSFIYDHQIEDHDGAPPNFTLERNIQRGL